MSESAFRVHALELGPMENFVYLIEDIASRRCAVVDPAWQVDQILATANQYDLNITDILLTHSHHDHINAIDNILLDFDAELHLTHAEAEFWGQAGTQLGNFFGCAWLARVDTADGKRGGHGRGG